MQIKTKQDFYRLSSADMLGNHMRSWTFDDLRSNIDSGSHLPPYVGARYCIPGSPLMKYWLTPARALEYADKLHFNGKADRALFRFDEHAPDDRLTLQCYVIPSDRFIDLRFSTAPGLMMREAWEQEVDRYISGAPAVAILRHFLDAPSQDFLWETMATYPTAVVELTAYSVSCGVFGWNTLFWEVRDY